MEIEAYIKKNKEIYSHLLSFIESTDDSETDYQKLISLFEELEIFSKEDDILNIFQTISIIESNHYRDSNFYKKIEKIFQYFLCDHKVSISCTKIFKSFMLNMKILLLILEHKLIEPDDNILYLEYRYQLFLYPHCIPFCNIPNRQAIEEDIAKLGENFDENRHIGENDSYISTLIRQDSIESFISYVNKTNISLNSVIKNSQYETHLFLLNHYPTLIEYAAFFGSILIFNYLKNNEVELSSSLWLYAVHSKNAEIIQILEENNVKPDDETFCEVLKESIKCHHNEFADYFNENFVKNLESDTEEDLAYCIIKSKNYHFYPDKIDQLISSQKQSNRFKLSMICYQIKIVTIPSTVTQIGEKAFNGCLSIEQIFIPSSVTSIGNESFSYCHCLAHISIPSSVKSIGNRTFYYCGSLKQISIPSSVTSIGDGVFYDCHSLTQITIPSSVKSIGNSSFFSCRSLKQISIPSSVTSIGDSAFYLCSSLEQISIPSSVTFIGINAFYSCVSFTKFEIPSSLTSISRGCFYGCTSLKLISIPSSIISIGCDAFGAISSLEITGSIKKIHKKMFMNHELLKEIKIPDSVKVIDNNAFNGCVLLSSISMPSIIRIGTKAFKNCKSLKEIIIPSTVRSLSKKSFCNCHSLVRVSIPPSVKSIRSKAFKNCTSLSDVVISSPINYLGFQIFCGCSSLNTISLPSSMNADLLGLDDTYNDIVLNKF